MYSRVCLRKLYDEAKTKDAWLFAKKLFRCTKAKHRRTVCAVKQLNESRTVRREEFAKALDAKSSGKRFRAARALFASLTPLSSCLTCALLALVRRTNVECQAESRLFVHTQNVQHSILRLYVCICAPLGHLFFIVHRSALSRVSVHFSRHFCTLSPSSNFSPLSLLALPPQF